MVIYIHGFSSSGFGAKAVAFRKYFKEKNEKFIAPSLSHIPDLAIQTLEELIESYECKVSLIGSSLGGYYCLYLANKYNLKATLINPSIYPYKTLKKCLGSVDSYYDASSFLWDETHLNSLKKYEVTPTNQANFMLLLQKGDETLDYREAIKKLPNAFTVLEENGSHGFDGIENHFERVNDFLTLSTVLI